MQAWSRAAAGADRPGAGRARAHRAVGDDRRLDAWCSRSPRPGCVAVLLLVRAVTAVAGPRAGPGRPALPGHARRADRPAEPSLLSPRWRLLRRAGAGRPGLAAVPRPRRLQARQRHLGPRGRRPAAAARSAQRLRGGDRRSDVVARIGGDEFVVAGPACRRATAIARWRQRSWTRSTRPVAMRGAELVISGVDRPRRVTADGRPAAPRACCATPTPRCTGRRPRAAAAGRCSTPRCTTGSRDRVEIEHGAAPRAGARRAAAALPADRRTSRPAGRRRRGAAALGAPGARAGLARRLHPDRGGDRADRRHRRVGARRGAAAGGRVASATVVLRRLLGLGQRLARQLRDPTWSTTSSAELAPPPACPARRWSWRSPSR